MGNLLKMSKPPLPNGWKVHVSSTYPDRVYYFNVFTGSATWELPVCQDFRPPSPNETPTGNIMELDDISEASLIIDEESVSYKGYSNDSLPEEDEDKIVQGLSKTPAEKEEIVPSAIFPLRPAIKNFLDPITTSTPKPNVRFSEHQQMKIIPPRNVNIVHNTFLNGYDLPEESEPFLQPPRKFTPPLYPTTHVSAISNDTFNKFSSQETASQHKRPCSPVNEPNAHSIRQQNDQHQPFVYATETHSTKCPVFKIPKKTCVSEIKSKSPLEECGVQTYNKPLSKPIEPSSTSNKQGVALSTLLSKQKDVPSVTKKSSNNKSSYTTIQNDVPFVDSESPDYLPSSSQRQNNPNQNRKSLTSKKIPPVLDAIILKSQANSKKINVSNGISFPSPHENQSPDSNSVLTNGQSKSQRNLMKNDASHIFRPSKSPEKPVDKEKFDTNNVTSNPKLQSTSGLGPKSREQSKLARTIGEKDSETQAHSQNINMSDVLNSLSSSKSSKTRTNNDFNKSKDHSQSIKNKPDESSSRLKNSLSNETSKAQHLLENSTRKGDNSKVSSKSKNLVEKVQSDESGLKQESKNDKKSNRKRRADSKNSTEKPTSCRVDFSSPVIKQARSKNEGSVQKSSIEAQKNPGKTIGTNDSLLDVIERITKNSKTHDTIKNASSNSSQCCNFSSNPTDTKSTNNSLPLFGTQTATKISNKKTPESQQKHTDLLSPEPMDTAKASTSQQSGFDFKNLGKFAKTYSVTTANSNPSSKSLLISERFDEILFNDGNAPVSTVNILRDNQRVPQDQMLLDTDITALQQPATTSSLFTVTNSREVLKTSSQLKTKAPSVVPKSQEPLKSQILQASRIGGITKTTEEILNSLPVSKPVQDWSVPRSPIPPAPPSETGQSTRSFGDYWAPRDALQEMEEAMEWEPADSGISSVSPATTTTTTASTDILDDMYNNFQKHSWHVVVDTNIFIEDLHFLTELQNTNYKGRGFPIIVFPYIVFQELDSLKDRNRRNSKNGEKVNQATVNAVGAAINFINTNLFSEHPRFRGQSLQEHTQHEQVFKGPVNNDDRILHFCSTLQKKGYKVSLLTHDKNLRNKAISSRIQAVTKNDIQKLEKITTFEDMQSLSAAQNDEAISGVLDKTEAAQADIIFCQLKMILQDILKDLLQHGMKSEFNAMWERIVVRKPPWTLDDILFCLKKHWMSVFGSKLPKDALNLVDDIVEIFHKHMTKKGYNHTLCEMKTYVETSRQLVLYVARFENLKSKVKSAVKKLNQLVSVCNAGCEQKLERLDPPWNSDSTSSLSFSGSCPSIANESTGSMWDLRSVWQEPKRVMGKDEQLMLVQQHFQALWEKLNTFCNNIKNLDSLSKNQPRAVEEVERHIATLHRIAKLFTQLNKKILDQKPESSRLELQELHSILMSERADEVQSLEDPFTVESLTLYYKEKADMLKCAQREFEEFIKILNRGIQFFLAKAND